MTTRSKDTDQVLPSSGTSPDPVLHRQQKTQHKARNQKNQTDDSKRKRRVNRPGFNSYLKVLIDNETMEILHKMSLEVQNRTASEGNDSEAVTEDVQDPTAADEAKTNPEKQGSKKRFRFKPRSLSSLHMTLFFGGETLCELPPDELSEWHQNLSVRFARSGFLLKDMTLSETCDCLGDYSFRVKRLQVFPPRRNNLVVAILEPAPLWHPLHDDVRKLSQDESKSPTLAEITRYSKHKWTAHITLGNIFGGTKSQTRNLNSLLSDIFEKWVPPGNAESTEDDGGLECSPIGISMGGPVPEQIDLDWDFRYVKVPSNAAVDNSGENPALAGDKTTSDEDVSERCIKALKPSSAYADAFMEAMNNQYDPVTRPNGFVPLCVAENRLTTDLLSSKLKELQTVEYAFSDPTAYTYNSFQGFPLAREAAASFIEKRFLYRDDHAAGKDKNFGSISPSNIGIGSGAAGILHSLFFLLGNYGDCCLIPAPYYAAFKNHMSLVAGVSPFAFDVSTPEHGPTKSELESAYDSARLNGLNPKFVLITNPHNPLGTIYSPETVKDTVFWARNRRLHTIVDEVYALSTHQKHGHGFESVIRSLDNQLEDNVHWVWSLSKDFGASGLRVGYVYSQNETFMKGFANLNGFSGVSQPIQMAASKLLSDDAFVGSYLDQSRERILKNYACCAEKLEELGIPFVRARAGLFVYADFSSLLPEKNMGCEADLGGVMAKHARVLLTPGDSQGDRRPGMFRICYAWVAPGVLQTGMDRLGRLVKQIRERGGVGLGGEADYFF